MVDEMDCPPFSCTRILTFIPLTPPIHPTSIKCFAWIVAVHTTQTEVEETNGGEPRGQWTGLRPSRLLEGSVVQHEIQFAAHSARICTLFVNCPARKREQSSQAKPGQGGRKEEGREGEGRREKPDGEVKGQGGKSS